MNDNSIDFGLIHSNSNERELAWIYHQLYRYIPYRNDTPIPVTKEELYNAITDLINRKHFMNLSERNSFTKSLLVQCKSALLPTFEFKWIDKRNDRLTSWLWLYLQYQYNLKPRIGLSSGETRYKDIVRYFDLSPATAHKKLTLLCKLSEKWTYLSNEKLFDIGWIDKSNIDLCLWASNYVENKAAPAPGTITPPSLLQTAFSHPYEPVTAAIDLWECSIENKQQFTIKMKQAWKQKQSRAKTKIRSGKVKYQIPEKYVSMLQDVTEMHGHKTASETLKNLIENEYTKLKRSWIKDKFP